MNGALDAARLGEVKALYNPNMTAAQKVAQGDFIDKWLGNVSAQRLGLSYKTQLIEKLIGFAPNYYRSYASLINDAVHLGNKSGRDTFRALTEFQIGAHIGFYAFAKAYQMAGGMKEEPNIIPGTPHYMQVRIGNVWVGMPSGGIAISVNQSLSRMAQNILSDEDLGTKITDIAVSDIGGFGISHMSRLGQIVKNTAAGTDYFGYSTTDGGAGKWIVNELIKGSAPISLKETLDSLADNAPIQDSMSTLAFNFVGLRVSPQTISGERREMLDTIAVERHGVSASQLQKDHYNDYLALFGDSRMAQFQEKLDADTIKKGAAWWDEAGKQLVAYSPKRDAISDKTTKEKNWIAHQLSVGTIDSQQYREAYALIGKLAGDEYDKLEKDYPLAIAKIREPRNIPAGASQLQAAYITYKDTVLNNSKLNESTDGITYSQTLKLLNTAFITKYGDKIYNDIQKMLVSTKDTHPINNSYVLDRNDINLSGYWELPRGTPERDLVVKGWLKQHPDIDAKLYKWGYTGTIQTDKAERMARNELFDLGITKAVPKALDMVDAENTKLQIDKQLKQLETTKHRGISMSAAVAKFSGDGYDYIGNARRHESAARASKTLDQQDKYLDLMFKEIDKTKQLQQLIMAYSQTAQPEYYLTKLNLTIQSWLLESESRYARGATIANLR